MVLNCSLQNLREARASGASTPAPLSLQEKSKKQFSEISTIIGCYGLERAPSHVSSPLSVTYWKKRVKRGEECWKSTHNPQKFMNIFFQKAKKEVVRLWFVQSPVNYCLQKKVKMWNWNLVSDPVILDITEAEWWLAGSRLDCDFIQRLLFQICFEVSTGLWIQLNEQSLNFSSVVSSQFTFIQAETRRRICEFRCIKDIILVE